MTDDPNQAEGKSVEERLEALTTTEEVAEKQPEAVPTSDQAPTEETDHNEDDLTLPEDASERTKKQFDKLKAKLREAEAKKNVPPVPEGEDYGASVFDSMRPQPSVQQQGVLPQAPSAERFDFLNQNQVDNTFAQFVTVDPQTGEQTVDINGLNLALFQLNEERKRQAQQQSAVEARLQETQEKVARFEESQQLKDAYQEFPELDPLNKEKFDPKFFELVKDRVIRRNHVEKKGLPLVDIAKEVSSYRQPIDKAKVEEEAVVNYKKQQEARNQGPLSPGRGVDRTASYDRDDVHKRIRRGDWAALDEALKEAGVK